MADDARVLPDVTGTTVGVLGGTGDQGRGLAYRFARSGLAVVVGSRDAQRGEKAAAELNALPGLRDGTGTAVVGGDNATAAARADVVIAAVPYEGHAALLSSLADELRGKIVVDCVNPIAVDKQGPHAIGVPEGSAAEQARDRLPDSRVVAAFHHVSAVLLADPELARIDGDILVLGDDRDAAAVVQALAERIPGARGVWAGRLRNAGQVEALTANLIAINKRYRTHAGLSVTGI